jgi:nucleoside phosphorylase
MLDWYATEHNIDDRTQRRRLAQDVDLDDQPDPESSAPPGAPSRRPRPARPSGAGGPAPSDLAPVDWARHRLDMLAPRAQEPPRPWGDHLPLPRADVVVITWTVAEWAALHRVFVDNPPPRGPGFERTSWRRRWLPYRRDFYEVADDLWLHRLIARSDANPVTSEGAPALDRRSLAWGSFCVVTLGAGTRVLLFKSELHPNTDGESLPLRRLVRQIIADAQPSLVLSIGTAGGVRVEDGLGDALVATSARFELSDEFRTASFNGQTFRSTWVPPLRQIARAQALLRPVDEFAVEPPTPYYPANLRLQPLPHTPRIKIADLPVLTTDRFEWGTTANRLWERACCVEMDDAVVAMACDEAKVPFGFVRNVSDPVLDGRLPRPLQAAWAVMTYRKLGLLTSFNGAIATWAVLATD